MRYHYRCGKSAEDRCQLANLPDTFFDGTLVIEIAVESHLIEVADGEIIPTSPLVWEVEHGMFEAPEVKCPICGSDAVRVIQKTSATYIRGNGYLDTKGCHRDMNLFKLTQQDPYAGMRQPGEADDLANRIRRGGKFNPKTKHFLT